MTKASAAASASPSAPQNDTEMADAAPPNPTTTTQPSQSTASDPQAAAQPPPAIIPGPRAQQLLTLHSRALTATLRTISPSTFSSCFPTIAASAPDVLSSIHTQFITRLREFAEADLAEILRERRVVENLNGLEGLIGDAKVRKARSEKMRGDGDGDGAEGEGEGEKVLPLPGHMQPPDRLLEAHLRGTLESARSKLNAREQTLLSGNAALFCSVREQYGEIDELMRGLAGVVGDLEGAGGLVGGV